MANDTLPVPADIELAPVTILYRLKKHKVQIRLFGRILVEYPDDHFRERAKFQKTQCLACVPGRLGPLYFADSPKEDELPYIVLGCVVCHTAHVIVDGEPAIFEM